MIINNKIIPFKGFKVITLFGLIFVRKDYVISKEEINHERIHIIQQYECFGAGLIIIKLIGCICDFSDLILLLSPLTFFFIYGLNYILILLRHKSLKSKQLCREIMFEKEAYSNQSNLTYLTSRKLFAFLKH